MARVRPRVRSACLAQRIRTPTPMHICIAAISVFFLCEDRNETRQRTLSGHSQRTCSAARCIRLIGISLRHGGQHREQRGSTGRSGRRGGHELIGGDISMRSHDRRYTARHAASSVGRRMHGEDATVRSLSTLGRRRRRSAKQRQRAREESGSRTPTRRGHCHADRR